MNSDIVQHFNSIQEFLNYISTTNEYDSFGLIFYHGTYEELLKLVKSNINSVTTSNIDYLEVEKDNKNRLVLMNIMFDGDSVKDIKEYDNTFEHVVFFNDTTDKYKNVTDIIIFNQNVYFV